MMKTPVDTPTIPRRVKSLIGLRFGCLVVLSYAGSFKGLATWCCRCDCGAMCRKAGFRLLGNRTTPAVKSCGCLSRSPEANAKRVATRGRNSMNESIAKARAAAEARRSASGGWRPYAMDPHLGAELMGVPFDRMMALVNDGTIRSRTMNGKLRISAADVAEFVAENERRKTKCGLSLIKELHRLRMKERKQREKFIECADCKIAVKQTRPHQQRCEACQKVRDADLKSQWQKRKPRTSNAVVPEDYNCADCGIASKRTSKPRKARQIRCVECQKARNSRKQKEWAASKRIVQV